MATPFEIDGYRIETDVSDQRIAVRCYAPGEVKPVGVSADGPEVTPAYIERLEMLALSMARDLPRLRRLDRRLRRLDRERREPPDGESNAV